MGVCLGREGHPQQGPCRRRPGGVSSRLDAEQATLGSRRRDLTVVGIRDPWVHMWAIDPTAPSEGLVSQLGPRAHWKLHCTTHTTPDGTPPIHSSSRHALQPLARPPFAPDHTSRPLPDARCCRRRRPPSISAIANTATTTTRSSPLLSPPAAVPHRPFAPP